MREMTHRRGLGSRGSPEKVYAGGINPFTFLVKREILRAAVFLWITFFDATFWMVGMARAKAFRASSRFFPSTAFNTLLEEVFRRDLSAELRSRLFSL